MIFDKFGEKENKIRKLLILLEENGVLGEPIWDGNIIPEKNDEDEEIVLGEPIWDGNLPKSFSHVFFFGVLGEPIWDGNEKFYNQRFENTRGFR